MVITIKPIHSTIAGKATEVDPEQLQEAMKMVAEAVQKRIEGEIVRGLTSPHTEPLKPSIKIDEDLSPYNRNSSILWNTHLRYGFSNQYKSHSPYHIGVDSAVGSGGTIISMPPNQHTTTRKDGREQLTCTCGVVAYPHRYKSVEGCGE